MLTVKLKAEQFVVSALLAAALLLFPAGAAAQARRPITREGLVKAVRINGLSTTELIQQIQSRGVSFQMTPDAEAELRAAGARPEVIAAARSNYHPAPAVAGAGARRPPAGSSRPSPAPSRRGPDYDELTDQATAAYDARDVSRATQLLQQAIQLNPQHPRAYQLLGFTQLYLQSNLAEAEKNMRKAIELGGSASFRVFHDHLNGTFNQTCAGTLFVTRANVTFKADDGRDTFEAADSLIKEIKTNKVSGGAFGMLLGGKNLGAFHIKVRLGSDSKNYNFAPLTNKKAEAELIVDLVKAYGGVQS
ncbi:MAG: tetratricopeptide repeat protein [Pyrinomonadaceae bacterium]